jgi:ribosome maturation factor RimP
VAKGRSGFATRFFCLGDFLSCRYGKAQPAVAVDRGELIRRLVEPSLEHLGFEVVRVVISGRHSPTVQIMAERKDRRNMTVDDCADISRNVSALLDVDDPFEGGYTLEVSSPGVDRPLVRKEDFARFAGEHAKVELREPHDGRRRLSGVLGGVRDELVLITCEGSVVEVSFSNIVKARLLVTEERISELLHQSKSG